MRTCSVIKREILHVRTKYSCLSVVAALGRTGPAPCLGSTVELTLDVGVAGELPHAGECKRTSRPTSFLLGDGTDEGETASPLPHSLPSMPGRRAVPWVMSVKELSLLTRAAG